ncbi:MAG: metallophosphoesterase, partial [Lachnospiraceae bacterium]|nr:metallophosphoesterase [Lachnospiraceae bacterium]
MKMRFLLFVLLLFALFTVVFMLPRLLEKEETPVSSLQTAEPQTETLEEKSFPYETAWGETEKSHPSETGHDPGGPVEREKLPAHILFASDIHYMSQSLTDYGNAFNELIDNGDGKAVRYMPQIWDAFAGEVIAAQPDVLVLSGDLTINGEKVNHAELAAHLAVIEAAGVPVVVIPGNHDINNPYATAYFGDEQSFIEPVTPEEFWQIYRAFGYDEAAGYAPDSMSYLYILNDTTWLLMLDT